MAEPVEQPAQPMAQLFSGDYTYPVDEFLALVEANTVPHKCYYGHTPHKTAYVANSLTGRARLWYVRWAGMREHKAPVYSERGASFSTAWKAYKDKHFEMFRRDFVAEFGIPETLTLHFEFRHLTQNRTSVKHYADQWSRLGECCKESLDSEYNRLWFVHGLQPQIRNHMLLVFPFHPTFTELVAEAAAMEESCNRPMSIDNVALSQAVADAVSHSVSQALSQAIPQAISLAVTLAVSQAVSEAMLAEKAARLSIDPSKSPKLDAPQPVSPPTPDPENETL